MLLIFTYALFSFYYHSIDMTLNNIIAFYFIIVIGLLCNIFLIMNINGERKK